MAKKKETAPAGAKPAVGELLNAYMKEAGPSASSDRKVANFPAGRTILSLDAEAQAEVVEGVLDRLLKCEKAGDSAWSLRCVWRDALEALLRRKLPLGERRLIRLLCWPRGHICSYEHCLGGLASAAEFHTESNEVSPALSKALKSLIRALPRQTDDKSCRKAADRLRKLLPGVPQIQIEPGEAWSDAALADLGRREGKARQAWDALLFHCQAGGRKSYSQRWRNEVGPLIDAVGFDAFKEHLLRWFPLVDKPRTQPSPPERYWEPDDDQRIIEPHVELLRGLAWCCGLREDADLARALSRLALSAYRKVPDKGPRLPSLGNACVTALGLIPGRDAIGQLAVLKVKVKSVPAQKEIEKAFNAAAAREGLPRDEVEELAVPSYGLEEVGRLRADFGDYRVELAVDGSGAGLHWFKGDTPVKSVPAAVRKGHAVGYKELQGALKDVNTMLSVQRERIDTLFLAQKSWPIAAWLERYLDHPLVGTIARRLIWSFATKGKAADGMWHGGELVGRNGKPLNLKGEPTVSLWHPIGRAVDEVLAWRDWLERREVVQPFKQAHREVYVLTDAERRTGTYSNRFAAHVLKQHQFNALCAARGWQNRLRLIYEGDYPPARRSLPAWGLRAEFWVEGAGDDPGRDANETGTFLYLTTDQVRFYAGAAAEPLSLEAVPPPVFSEVMRDVDLFVGVASVGNDPNWADGGPGGRYRDYWQGYSFGELSATAQTRRAILERLVPRLRIADRCSFSDRFLIVRGDLRGYKIHLGSGNILMTPNDQYLCIVPKQATAGPDRLFLPFEGDNTLSIILSKAFLLAGDTKITDPSIVSQLER